MTAFLLAVGVGALIGAFREPHGAHLRAPVVVFPAVVVIGVRRVRTIALSEQGLCTLQHRTRI